MKLAFKNRFIGYSEKDIDIILNIGTLEAVCKSLDIEFWQISDAIKNKGFDFSVELLYQGYLSACKLKYETSKKRFERTPKYTLFHAAYWHEHLSKEAQKELLEKMNVLLSGISKMSKSTQKGSKKKVS